MKGKRGQGTILVLAAIALLALVFAGCGGGDSTTASGGTNTEAAAKTTSDGSKSPSGPMERSKPFAGPGGENIWASFGHEASAAELSEVNEIVRESLEARQAHDWAGQCATLAASALETLGAEGQSDCVAKLKPQGERASASLLKNNLDGSVAAFRLEGNRGYALYHGVEHEDWAMPMEREGGEWKLAALTAEGVPR